MKDGQAYVSGQVSHQGEELINTHNYEEPLVNLQESLMENCGLQAKFVDIKAGNSHALLLDDQGCVYTYGLGVYGQIGRGFEYDVCRFPCPVTDINDVCDRVTLIACGPNYCLCYSENGNLYYWGMLVPEDVAGVKWFPNFMPISI